MTLTLGEVRERAERWRSEWLEETYRVQAGLTPAPRFEELCRVHPILEDEGVVSTIERGLAEAAGDEERRLRRLLDWAAGHRVDRARAAFEDEYRAWEARATLEIGGRELPLRRIPSVVANTGDRDRRLALESRRNEIMEEALPLRVDAFQAEREAVAGLGYGSYTQARERLSGIDLARLGEEAERILERTRDAHRELLAHHLESETAFPPSGLSARDADRADLRRLARMPGWDGHLRVAGIETALREDLSGQGLSLEAGGRIELDREERPLKRPSSSCVPIRIPDRVVVVLAPEGGGSDCAALLREVGRALAYAYADPSASFEDRSLGDESVARSFGLLFGRIMTLAAWAEGAAELSGERLDRYLRLGRFLELCEVRGTAARLGFERGLWEGGISSNGAPEDFAERLESATGFRHDPRTYLEGVGPGLRPAVGLRAWLLCAILERELRARFDEDWFRNPRTGSFLLELFEHGGERDAAKLAAELGGESLGADALVASFRERLS